MLTRYVVKKIEEGGDHLGWWSVSDTRAKEVVAYVRYEEDAYLMARHLTLTTALQEGRMDEVVAQAKEMETKNRRDRH